MEILIGAGIAAVAGFLANLTNDQDALAFYNKALGGYVALIIVGAIVYHFFPPTLIVLAVLLIVYPPIFMAIDIRAREAGHKEEMENVENWVKTEVEPEIARLTAEAGKHKELHSKIETLVSRVRK